MWGQCVCVIGFVLLCITAPTDLRQLVLERALLRSHGRQVHLIFGRLSPSVYIYCGYVLIHVQSCGTSDGAGSCGRALWGQPATHRISLLVGEATPGTLVFATAFSFGCVAT